MDTVIFVAGGRGTIPTHFLIDPSLINVAKPKTKLRPRKKAIADADSDPPGLSQSDLETPDSDAQPVQPRPLLFKISLALFIGWLLFLAFVAYRVMYP